MDVRGDFSVRNLRELFGFVFFFHDKADFSGDFSIFGNLSVAPDP